MNLYRGIRYHVGKCDVTVNGAPLPLCLHVRNHSPTGFEWGYGGSGPSQLALALLVAEFTDPRIALRIYQRFKWAAVIHLARAGWTLTSDQIREAVRDLPDTP